jgi:hypothetical protein
VDGRSPCPCHCDPGLLEDESGPEHLDSCPEDQISLNVQSVHESNHGLIVQSVPSGQGRVSG